MKLSKQQLTLGLIAGVITIIAGLKMFSTPAVKQIDSVAARSKGAAQAKVQIIEFIDMQCPACAAGSKILKGYTDKHPDDIHLQVKYFPLIRNHRHAMSSALYSECSGRQGRFWEFHELLMSVQPQWSELISAEGVFDGFAKQAGVDIEQLRTCMSSENASAVINQDRSLGQSLGVQSTPTYFINNKMVVGGQSLVDELNTYFPPDKS